MTEFLTVQPSDSHILSHYTEHTYRHNTQGKIKLEQMNPQLKTFGKHILSFLLIDAKPA